MSSSRGSALALAALVMLGAAGCGSSDAAEEPTSTAPSSTTATTGSPAPDDGPTTALFFGDSYVIGGGYTDADTSMAALAADELDWQYHLAGGGGTGFATGNEEYDLPPYPEQIDAGALAVGPVDWLVVEGGGNDDDVAPDAVTDAAVDTLEAAAASHPEAQVVLVAAMDPTVDDFGDTDDVTEALAAAADRARVPFVDGQRWLEGHADLVGPDYDHPLPEGHVLCGRRLAAALQDLG